MSGFGGRPFWRRADIMVVWLRYVFPVLCLMAAGLYLIITEGWLIQFAAASLAWVVVLFVAGLLLRRWKSVDRDAVEADIPPVVADADWSPRERQVFDESCARIRHDTRKLCPWDEELVILALNVARNVAQEMSGRSNGSHLDVSVLELLTLIDEAADECREFLGTNRWHAPFRGISVGNILLVLRNRHRLARGIEYGEHAYGVARLVMNPPAGAMQVMESLIAGNNTKYLTDQVQLELQRRILYYVAAKSINLYSGRYRRGIVPGIGPSQHEPVRILMVGQAGVGKSAMASLLAPAGRAASTANGAEAGVTPVRTEIGGIQCALIEAPPIDALEDRARHPGWFRFIMRQAGQADPMMDAVRSGFLDCDMVVWTVRADQPARKVDIDTLAVFQGIYDELRWNRLMPPLVVAVSHVDRPPIIEIWPDSGDLSPAQVLKIENIAGAVAREFDVGLAVPVKLDPPGWNGDELTASIRNALPNACLAQRNRVRNRQDGNGDNRIAGADGPGQRKQKGRERPGEAPADGRSGQSDRQATRLPRTGVPERGRVRTGLSRVASRIGRHVPSRPKLRRGSGSKSRQKDES